MSLKKQQFDQVIEKLLLGIAPKIIAASVGVTYNYVIQIKNRYIETAYRLKDVVPKEQLGFHFYHGHNKKSENEDE